MSESPYPPRSACKDWGATPAWLGSPSFSPMSPLSRGVVRRQIPDGRCGDDNLSSFRWRRRAEPSPRRPASSSRSAFPLPSAGPPRARSCDGWLRHRDQPARSATRPRLLHRRRACGSMGRASTSLWAGRRYVYTVGSAHEAGDPAFSRAAWAAVWRGARGWAHVAGPCPGDQAPRCAALARAVLISCAPLPPPLVHSD